MGWITTKQTMGLVYIIQILSHWIGPYRQKKSFRHTAKIGLWEIFQFSIFFSAARNAIAKATEYVTFGFSFRILVFFPF